MTIKERIKAWWEYFINTYTAYGDKEEVIDPLIAKLEEKGFVYIKLYDHWTRTWSTNNGDDKVYEQYNKDSLTGQWSQVMKSMDGSIIFENTKWE